MRYKLCKCGAVKQDYSGSICAKCGSGRKQKSRTTAEYGYDNQWRLLSEKIRQERPLCEACLRSGISTAADEVHHIIPIDEAPWLRLEPKNLLSLCTACHDKIHAKALFFDVGWHRRPSL